MNRRAAMLLALALGLAACGRRGSPRKPKGDAEDDESAPQTGRPPPPDFERKDDE